MLPAEIEMQLRREWFFNHGHEDGGLYYDDGEMQCYRCPADFKRDPLDWLNNLVFRARLAAAVRKPE